MMWLPIRLGRPHSCGLDICSPHNLLPGLALLAMCSFPLHIFHIPGITNSLWSPLNLRLHSLALCLTLLGAVCRNSDPATYSLASQAFPWNLGGILHSSATLVLCMSTESASQRQCQGLPPAQEVSTWTASNCNFNDLWVPGWLRLVKWIQGKQLSRSPHESRMTIFPIVTVQKTWI
jgi:hypothetical protein